MKQKDTPEIAAKRQECLALVRELELWDVRPFKKDRLSLNKQIRYTRNLDRLDYIHNRLEALLNNAMMKKLSQGIDYGESQ